MGEIVSLPEREPKEQSRLYSRTYTFFLGLVLGMPAAIGVPLLVDGHHVHDIAEQGSGVILTGLSIATLAALGHAYFGGDPDISPHRIQSEGAALPDQAALS